MEFVILVFPDRLQIGFGKETAVVFTRLQKLEGHFIRLHHLNSDGIKNFGFLVPVGRIFAQNFFILMDKACYQIRAAVPDVFIGRSTEPFNPDLFQQLSAYRIETGIGGQSSEIGIFTIQRIF